MKNITDPVKDAVIKAAKRPGTLLDHPAPSARWRTTASRIAPYHEFDSKIDADLKAEVEKLKADIIAGTIKVDSPAQPK